MHQKNENGTFTSKIGFVLAAVGSAVGMGNIWMFPYRTGQYGGAAFFKSPYLLFIALFGYVGLSGEFAFGRMTGTGPIGSYEFAMKSRGKKGRRHPRYDSSARLARYRHRLTPSSSAGCCGAHSVH